MAAPFRIGLALGGGAARAFSHVGVIAGLERHGIAIDIVTGTSMGAIFGAMYAVHPDAACLRQHLDDYLQSEAFSESGFDFFRSLDSEAESLWGQVTGLVRRGLFNTLIVTRTALISDETATRNYAYLVADQLIEEARLPFAAVALDLRSGERVVLDHGPLRTAVAASCAMPGVLNPVEHEGRLLVDGGWAEAVPVAAARQLGADFVIAVEVGDPVAEFDPPRNALDVIGRADALARCALANLQLADADFVLTPENGVSHWADFSTAEQAIQRGEEEIERRIGELQATLRQAQRPPFWKFWKTGRGAAD